MAKRNRFPAGWTEARIEAVRKHYEEQTDDEAVAEDEAAAAVIMMEVPAALVPVVRQLIAQRRSGGKLKTNTTLRSPVGSRGTSKSPKAARTARR